MLRWSQLEPMKLILMVTGEQGLVPRRRFEGLKVKSKVDITGRATASIVDKDLEITVDGAMAQWIRWGLDNIGNNTLSSSSWWKNLDSYEILCQSARNTTEKLMMLKALP